MGVYQHVDRKVALGDPDREKVKVKNRLSICAMQIIGPGVRLR